MRRSRATTGIPAASELAHARDGRVAGGADDRPVDSKRCDGVQEVRLPLRPLVRVPEEDGQALLVRDLLDLVHDRREVRVRQVWDEDGDHSQPSSAEPAREPVRHVAELLDRPFDPRPLVRLHRSRGELMTRETVICETPARSATSAMVTCPSGRVDRHGR